MTSMIKTYNSKGEEVGRFRKPTYYPVTVPISVPDKDGVLKVKNVKLWQYSNLVMYLNQGKFYVKGQVTDEGVLIK